MHTHTTGQMVTNRIRKKHSTLWLSELKKIGTMDEILESLVVD